MNLFERLKNLITRNKQQKIASTDIVGYDTSLVYIPEYKSLSPEDKAEVNKYMAETKIENIDDVIFFGNGVSKYSEGITELLLSTLYGSTEQMPDFAFRKMPSEDVAKTRIEAMIVNEQIKYYQNALYSLNRETTLRTVALKEMYKKHNSIFKRIFESARAERAQRQFEKVRFEEAIERMKISKKIIEQQIQAVLNTGTSIRNNSTSNRSV